MIDAPRPHCASHPRQPSIWLATGGVVRCELTALHTSRSLKTLHERGIIVEHSRCDVHHRPAAAKFRRGSPTDRQNLCGAPYHEAITKVLSSAQ